MVVICARPTFPSVRRQLLQEPGLPQRRKINVERHFGATHLFWPSIALSGRLHTSPIYRRHIEAPADFSHRQLRFLAHQRHRDITATDSRFRLHDASITHTTSIRFHIGRFHRVAHE